MYQINCEIKPIFKADEKMCKDFAQLELLCDLYRGHNHNDWYKTSCEDYYLQCEKEKNRFIFAAYYDKEIIGFTNGYVLAENMYLDNFYVHPMYQGFGIGTELLKRTENAASIIKPNLKLCPLSSAVSFYQQYKYNFAPGGKYMIKKLPKTVNGVEPVFEWCDELTAKLSFKVDTESLKRYKYQAMFVYVGKDNKIDGVAVRLPNGEKEIKINDKQKSLAKYRMLELSCALDDCR